MTITTKLAQFAEWVLIEGAFHGHDLEGGLIQDKAQELGLLTETIYDPEVHGESEFDTEAGDPWYVFSDALQAALKDE